MPAPFTNHFADSPAPTVDAPVTARLLLVAAARDGQPGTSVLVLDDERRLLAALSVAGATGRDCIHDVVGMFCSEAHPFESVAALVVCSDRCGDPVDATDIDRWYAVADRCEQTGIELVEWFIDDGQQTIGMRDATGGLPIW